MVYRYNQLFNLGEDPMSPQLDSAQWFTEICEESGSAFSLKIHNKIHEETTPFQTIAIYDTQDFGHLMTIDGFIMLSERDNFFYHEMMAHPILCTHPNPEHVAIIGGGDCGTLKEVLKHPQVKSLTQVDIDERVTRLSEHYFPQLCERNQDPRAHLLFEDGIQWIRAQPDNALDVIIVDSTDPIGPGEKLFTQRFYHECARALRPNGLFIQQSESPLIHQPILKEMYRAIRNADFQDFRTLCFYQPVYPTGFWSATLATKATLNYEDFRKQPGLETQYYCPQTHLGALAQFPLLEKLRQES